MLHLLREAGLLQRFRIDSAGTGAYHVGEPADARSAAAASRRGVELPSRARQFKAEDFDAFDYVIAMDRHISATSPASRASAADAAKIHLLRSFDERKGGDLDVPDPYYGEGDGFARVFDICDAGCRGLLSRLRAEVDGVNAALAAALSRALGRRSGAAADLGRRHQRGVPVDSMTAARCS